MWSTNQAVIFGILAETSGPWMERMQILEVHLHELAQEIVMNSLSGSLLTQARGCSKSITIQILDPERLSWDPSPTTCESPQPAARSVSRRSKRVHRWKWQQAFLIQWLQPLVQHSMDSEMMKILHLHLRLTFHQAIRCKPLSQGGCWRHNRIPHPLDHHLRHPQHLRQDHQLHQHQHLHPISLTSHLVHHQQVHRLGLPQDHRVRPLPVHHQGHRPSRRNRQGPRRVEVVE